MDTTDLSLNTTVLSPKNMIMLPLFHYRLAMNNTRNYT